MSRIKNIFLVNTKLYFILLILQLSFYCIKCDVSCSECTLDNSLKCKKDDTDCDNCVSNFETKQCYNKIEGTTYYKINNDEVISMDNEGCLNKVIYETNECVGHCPSNTYELGDFCYIRNNLVGNYKIDENLKTVECKYKYYIQEISNSNKKQYVCLDGGGKCSDNEPNYLFYDDKTNQCIEKCVNKKIKQNENEGEDLRCSDECKSGEFAYSDIGDEGNTITYCSDTKEDKCKYYYTLENNVNICVNECNEGDFSENDKCVSECSESSQNIIVDLSSEDKIIKCSSSGNIDRSEYKYSYENKFYFKNCVDTQYFVNLKRITYENGEVCLDNCPSDNKYIVYNEYKCTNCQGKKYYGTICYDDCPPGHNYIITGNDNSPSECVDKCPADYYESESKKCFPLSDGGVNCPEGQYINSTFQCNTCTKPVNSSSIKKGEGYYVNGKRFCYSFCPPDALYHNIDENICSGTVCKEREEYKYSAYDNPYICYKSCEDINEDYKYEKDFICYKTQTICDSYYYIENNIIQCASYDKCKEKFKYIKEKQCVTDCEPNYYKIKESYDTNGKIQDLGGCFRDESGCINEGYLFYNKTDKLCLRECDAFKLSSTGNKANDLGETCFSSCPSSHPYKDIENNLCLEKCPSYYYKYECLTSTCKEKNKFNFKGEFECLDSCQKSIGNSLKYYYYDNDAKICYNSCNEAEGKGFILPNENNSPIECKAECGSEYKFYYEDKKICRSSCDILYKSETENICVSQCAQGQKVYNNICYDVCPTNPELGSTSKIYKEKLNNKISLIVEKCVKDCSNHLSSKSTNYCYDECPSNEGYIYNNSCYEKCPDETFANPITKECYSNCTEGLKFYDIVNGTKICKIRCPSNKFILSNETNGGKCYDECPSEYNYIGGNNTCLKNCFEQPDIGRYIEIIKETPNKIYKCSFSCGDKYTNVETKECLTECPYNYYTSPNKMCYAHNCSLDYDYPFASKDDNGNKICAKKCHSSIPIFGDDKICKETCNGNEVVDYDGKCVSKCENSYYKYNDNGKCVEKCPDGKKIHKNNICVDNCPSPENFVEGNECRTSCDSGHFQKDNTATGETKCVEKCESNEFYYETGSIYNIYKCGPCEERDYIIENTQICIKECPNQYYIYFDEEQRKCVLKCPVEKPLNDQRTCVKECPKTGNKYHIDGETNCRYSCPEGSKIDNNVCKGICPEDQFLDFNGINCIEECVGNYLYYIKGIKQCLRECPIKDGYFIEDKECVTSCSVNKPFLSGSNCQEDCSDYVEEYSHNNCTKKCPDDHPFFKKGTIGDKNIKYCIRDCELSMPDGECVSQCNDTFKYINYENRTCLKSCPSFYVTNLNNYICYSKCPDDYPFYNIETKECKNSCGETEYINITTNECMSSCNFKTFDNSPNKYCLEKCDDMGLFQFGENQCLKDCSNGQGESNMVPNFATKACECKYLYTIKEGKKLCKDGEECDSNEYRLFGTQICLENCNNYIYSLNGKYCYQSDKYCPQNTKKISYEEDGKTKYKCQCSFKYYKENNEYFCLNENEECPSAYPILTIETNKCVKQCEDEKYVKIGNLCLNKTECNNKNSWYLDENNNIKCTEECPDSYKYLIDETKHCVSKCLETEYYITDKNKCISTCPTNTIVQKTYVSSNNDSKEIIYICACNTDLWYIDDDNNYNCISDDTKTKCQDIDPVYKFQVKDTKQCVKSCPPDHPFSFDNECFIQCEDIKNYYDYDIVQSGVNECKCKDLWKKVDDKMVCIRDKICKGEGTNLLIHETRQCTNECPSNEQYKKFNNTCYKNSCPSNTFVTDDGCQCQYKWYKYSDSLLNVNDIIICFENETIDCNKDFYPYFNKETKECIEDFSKCSIADKKIYNNTCSKECPEKTKNDNSNCVCDKEYGVWHKYTDNGQIYIVCGLTKCPPNKNFLDSDTLECKYSCDNDKYLYNNGCYSNCPEYTIKNELSKECIESISFGEIEDLKGLETKVKSSNISIIYNKTSTVGLVYNIKNSSMQIYGVNKRKTPNHNLLMRSNLTYIDLSHCIDRLYADNNLDDDTDIVIVKYDIGDVTDSTTINPVEFKLFNSKNGKEITNLNGCNNNAIIISYPLSSILNNYPPESESNRLRNIEEKDIITLNLRQKFLIGKELYLEDEEIDTFNIENKIYTDMCYSLQINGVDLILEDRVTYLYPDFPFCESNCIYNRADFNLERIFCNCSPKQAFNLEREFESSNTVVDMEKVKNNQKGTLLKCLFKVSNISHNFGFFYGLIIILAEIGLMILTLFYSYKMLNILIKKRFNIKSSIDLDSDQNEQLNNKIYKDKKKEEIVKTTQRVLGEESNPPKKNNKPNANDSNKKKDTKKVSEDKKAIKNKKQGINSGKIEKLKLDEDKSNKLYSSNSESSSYDKIEGSSERDSEEESIFKLIKAEEKLLRLDYDNAIKKNTSEILITILAEIADKIYLIKSIFLLQKYELFSLYFSLYLLWHMVLLSFLSLFYTNSTLHKIWIRDSYPDLNYYLAFGFVSGIISFIIYRALYFLINYSNKLNEMKNIPNDNNEEIEQQYNKMQFWNKIKLIIYYVVEFILLIIFFLYLISFCGIYTVTQSKLVQSYGIALIEIIIIKIIYGLILGILRRVSLSYKVNKLYNVVRFLDMYIT